MCAFRGECCRCCVVYQVTCKFCGELYVGNTKNTIKKTEQHLQYMAQKSMNNNNSEFSLLTLLKLLRKNQVHNNVARLCILK